METVFEVLGLSDKVTYEAAQPEHFHPGRTAAVLVETPKGREVIGYVGQLHPALQLESDLADTYVLEIGLGLLYELASSDIEYKVLPRYPAMQRDIAVVVSQDIPAAKLTDAAWHMGGELLESVRIFDVYTGEKLGNDKKSVALSLVYRHAERTLTDEEVTELHGRIVTELEQSFGAELRK
ncbi:Phenylalanine--tRNA ligase beta subunit [compost metagenome]